MPPANKRKKSTGKSKGLSLEDALQVCRVAQGKLEESFRIGELLAEAGLRSPLIVFGEDGLRSKRFLSWLREDVLRISDSGVYTFFGTEFSNPTRLQALKSALTNRSLFDPEIFVVIHDADKIKAAQGKDVYECLLSEQGTSSPVLVVLLASTIPAKSWLAKLASQGTKIEAGEMSKRRLEQWIIKEAKRIGLSAELKRDAVSYLIDTFGADTTALAHQIAKVALYADVGELVDKELLVRLVPHSPESTSFQLLSAIAKRKVDIAFELGENISRQGFHPLQTLSFLGRCFRILLVRAGRSPAEGDPVSNDATLSSMPAELYNAWFWRQISPFARLFSKRELALCLELLKKLDLDLKSSKLAPEVLMSLAIENLALRNFSALPKN